MRTVGLVTTSRSDWGIQRPIAEALQNRQDVSLSIIAGGMHLSRACGHTVDEIIADGFPVAHRLDYLAEGDGPEAIAESIGRGVHAFTRLFTGWRPDILSVLGDRFEMFAAVVAATPFLIPIAHIHGGAVTSGAIDDAFRHAMTKMSHIHLVSTETYGRRVRQMGEPAEHVHVVGAAGLDDILRLEPLGAEVLKSEYGFDPAETNVLVVYHPETRSFESAKRDVGELLAAIDPLQANMVIVRPNADTANRVIHEAIDGFCASHPRAKAPLNLPRRTFLSLMRAASVMVGNSSSGILEAPSMRTPVVNIGLRQEGRVRARNVIDCDTDAASIAGAVERALSPQFRASLEGMTNPYGDGHSGERIARILAEAPLGRELRLKRFVDMA